MGDQYEPLANNGPSPVGALPFPSAPPPPPVQVPAPVDQNQYEVPQFPPPGAVAPAALPVSQPVPAAEKSKHKVKSNKETASTVLQSAPPGVPSEIKEKEKETVQAEPNQLQKTVEEDKLKTDGQEDIPAAMTQPNTGCRSKYSRGQCCCIISCSILLILLGILLSAGYGVLTFVLLRIKETAEKT